MYILICTLASRNTSTHPSFHPSIHQPITPSIHTSIHPHIHTSINPSIHTYIHTVIYMYVFTCKQTRLFYTHTGKLDINKYVAWSMSSATASLPTWVTTLQATISELVTELFNLLGTGNVTRIFQCVSRLIQPVCSELHFIFLTMAGHGKTRSTQASFNAVASLVRGSLRSTLTHWCTM